MNAWDLNSRLRPSRIHQAGLAVLYLACLAAVWTAHAPIWAAAAASLAWLLSAGMAWQRFRPGRGETVREIHWVGDEMSVVLGSGQRIRVELRRADVWRQLVVLTLKARDIGWNEQVLLLPDSLSPEEFRRWRVRLLAAR